MIDVNSMPVDWWWLVLGVFLFVLLLPLVTAQRVLSIWYSLNKANRLDNDQKKVIGFVKMLLLGWLVLVPVYAWSFHYVNARLILAS